MPSVSKQQQKFMGIVRAIQKGEAPAGKFSKAAQKAAKSMKKSSVRKYAKTKHDDLPKKVKEDRNYKDEYKKFQSSKKAKKYRAELNKYNRQKGTYGNGDGKDASHKRGKIVGFEAQSKNRGRAEKSRLKKEAKGEDMANLQQRNLANSYIAKFDKDIKGVIKYLGNAGNRKKAMDLMKIYKKHWVEFVIQWQKRQKLHETVVKEASMKFAQMAKKRGFVKKGQNDKQREKGIVDYLEKWANKDMKGAYPDPWVRRIQIPGHGPAQDWWGDTWSYVKKVLGENINEKKGDFLSSLFPKSKVDKAIKIAKKMSGNMTGAVKAIEKFFPGMSRHNDVQDALRKYNESVNEAINHPKVQKQAKELAKVLKNVVAAAKKDDRKLARKLVGNIYDIYNDLDWTIQRDLRYKELLNLETL